MWNGCLSQAKRHITHAQSDPGSAAKISHFAGVPKERSPAQFKVCTVSVGVRTIMHSLLKAEQLSTPRRTILVGTSSGNSAGNFSVLSFADQACVSASSRMNLT